MSTWRLAPEWARQDAVILVWPHLNSDWREHLNIIEPTYTELTRYICRNQKLILVAYDANHIEHIQQVLAAKDIQQHNILFIDIPTNDTWVRDFGPLIVHSQQDNKLMDFTFNAWGKKYKYKFDNEFNKNLIERINLDIDYQRINFVLEAGNLEVNSLGTLLISSNCVERSQELSRKELVTIENNLVDWFGVDEVIWLHNINIPGDDTDGHIDNLARFSCDDTILYTSQNNSHNSAVENLEQQLRMIKHDYAMINELVPLPMPQTIVHQNIQLPATYTNFLITNTFVFVPVFNDKQDNHALKIIDAAFVNHEIIDIDATSLIKQFGGIHCAAMQLPEGILA